MAEMIISLFFLPIQESQEEYQKSKILIKF